MFSDVSGLKLHNNVNKDIIMNVTNYLLSARQKGHDQLMQLLQERHVTETKVDFSDLWPKTCTVSHILVSI